MQLRASNEHWTIQIREKKKKMNKMKETVVSFQFLNNERKFEFMFFSLSLFSCNYVLILYVYEDYLLWQFKKGGGKKKRMKLSWLCVLNVCASLKV